MSGGYPSIITKIIPDSKKEMRMLCFYLSVVVIWNYKDGLFKTWVTSQLSALKVRGPGNKNCVKLSLTSTI